MNYYVYVYLNPTKELDLDLGFYQFDYTPFYIGKGKSNRKSQSLKDVFSNKSTNQTMIEEIKDIRLFHSQEPIIDVVMDNLTEKQAYVLESYLIDYFGVESLSNRINGRYTSLLNEGLDIEEMLELLSDL